MFDSQSALHKVRHVLNHAESEVVRTALRPYLLAEVTFDKHFAADYDNLLTLLADEPDRDTVLAVVDNAEKAKRKHGCNVAVVYQMPGTLHLYEYVVVGEHTQDDQPAFLTSFTPNLSSGLSPRIFDLAWDQLRTRSLWGQVRSLGHTAIFFLAACTVVGVGLCFLGTHAAEKILGGMLLLVAAHGVWQGVHRDRQNHNMRISRIESYLRKLEFMPHVTPIQIALY